jgi:3-isopropylmalate/(R)-2-methylmalate dehydratase large subunit
MPEDREIARTLYEKLWDSHVVRDHGDGTALIYVDRHLLHETSTHQSFAGLRAAGRTVHRRETNLAVPDHAVPTSGRDLSVAQPSAAAQIATLRTNAHDFGIEHIELDDARQGIVHVVGPELGITLPGITLACGDSHTSTHGAFGALAFGIGASDCETVLATQTIVQRRSATMEVRLTGALPVGVGAKDVALALIGRHGTGFAVGHAVEYRGPVIDAMSMAARMTLCNMTIEAGARVGLVAPDETTFAWLAGAPRAPKGAAFEAACAYWRTLPSDPGAAFDRTITLDVSDLAPQVSWGTSPQDSLPIGEAVPDPAAAPSSSEGERWQRALDYMGLAPGMPLRDIAIDRVFIGSCTNGRIEDLREAADVLRGRQVAASVRAMVVPGSTSVRRQAEREGLDAVFRAAGAEWREAGCSMCVAMNGDMLAPGERCASTSNRNFEGRQGPGGRTHLVSPAMAAAAAVAGHLSDVRELAR